VLSFPKGVVTRPTAGQRAGWFLSANRGVVAGLAGACLLLGFLYWRWSLVGRDPRAGPRYPRYEPPPGLGAAGVRYLDKMGADTRAFSAALLGLGARGFLKLRQAGGAYDVERTGKDAEFLPGERAIADLLPPAGTPIRIGGEHDARVQQALGAFGADLGGRFGQALFSKNRGSLVAGIALAGAAVFAMANLDAPPVFVFSIGGGMALLLLFFARVLPAYSVNGRKLQDGIEGLRLYLSVAEADDLKRMKAPPQTAEEFARLLPYAVALDVEKTWADRFTQVLGASAVAAAAAHYYQSEQGFGSADGFSQSIGSLGESVSAAATPPGSSSGSSDSGGGGSSGGGGGGGGGSGW